MLQIICILQKWIIAAADKGELLQEQLRCISVFCSSNHCSGTHQLGHMGNPEEKKRQKIDKPDCLRIVKVNQNKLNLQFD